MHTDAGTTPLAIGSQRSVSIILRGWRDTEHILAIRSNRSEGWEYFVYTNMGGYSNLDVYELEEARMGV